MSDKNSSQTPDKEYLITGDKLQSIVDTIDETNQMKTKSFTRDDDMIIDITKRFSFVTLKKVR